MMDKARSLLLIALALVILGSVHFAYVAPEVHQVTFSIDGQEEMAARLNLMVKYGDKQHPKVKPFVFRRAEWKPYAQMHNQFVVPIETRGPLIEVRASMCWWDGECSELGDPAEYKGKK